MKSRTVMVIASVLILSACTANRPKDLNVASAILLKPDRVKSLVGDSIHESWFLSDFILVELTTNLDLVEYTKEKDYPLSYSGRFCNEIEKPIFTFGLYSEHESYATQSISFQQTTLTLPERDGFSYFVLFPVSFSKDVEIYGRPEREGAIFYKKYDLAKNTNEICFTVGGSIYGFGFKSNTTVLQRKKIKMILGE